MRETPVIIDRVWRSAGANTVQFLDIPLPAGLNTVTSGQFFLARVTESLDPYLREPWIPIRRRGNTVTIERPLAESFQPSQVISLLGPLGHPVTLRESGRTVLLIAHEATPAPLLMIAEAALADRRAVMLVLTGGAARYPLEVLPAEIEVIRGDERGEWTESLSTIKWADQIVSVASPPFEREYYLRLVEKVRRARGEFSTGILTGLFHPPMPCGIGLCGACLIRCGSVERFICVEGPGLELLEVSL